MPELSTVLLVVDTGLLVLIWIVQAVIYPSFRSVEANAFKAWHRDYTRKMGYIAAPLMIAQLVATSFQVLQNYREPLAVIHFALAVSSWVATFALSVPLHDKLQTHGNLSEIISRLVSKNWIRTILWTLTFAISLGQLLAT
ncbi:hypothetical protein QEH56_04260 [Pelagicoccus enzymogenes]|uniref:hypothetical protein n=1 Tax=Pelagicoccus enzymogenes TaxID=2773457 RepID=UPI00280DC011|nr:hypothetical protein [Pelagicoccus enzymogenes]MDQ8197345.1 hypothetical protein [Pelagicoccus enzymogenes]